jgi:hypothetical protein
VHGLSPVPVSHLPNLSATLEYARKECAAAPATIELLVDGLYVVIHQERGWPRQLLASETERPPPAAAKADLNGLPIWIRFLAWLRGPRRLLSDYKPAAFSKLALAPTTSTDAASGVRSPPSWFAESSASATRLIAALASGLALRRNRLFIAPAAGNKSARSHRPWRGRPDSRAISPKTLRYQAVRNLPAVAVTSVKLVKIR